MDEKTLCPSSKIQDGAILLGVIQAGGRVAYLNEQVTIDQDFINTAQQGRAPEKRFRFASKCVESNCKQWTGSNCGVIENALKHAKEFDIKAEGLPSCSIRSNCRWFKEQGKDACYTCPFIITDTRQNEQVESLI